jgi:hypothetical protein
MLCGISNSFSTCNIFQSFEDRIWIEQEQKLAAGLLEAQVVGIGIAAIGAAGDELG